MKALLILLTALLLFPCPAQASDLVLKPLKPKAKMMTAAGSLPSIDFSDFKMLRRGDGTYDWYVTATNTSDKNMARNQYALETWQVDKYGKRFAASPNGILRQDVRPGRSMNLQLPFTPVSNYKKIGFAIKHRQSGTVIGSREFAERLPMDMSVGKSSAATSVNKPNSTGATAFATPASTQFAITDLRLGLRYMGGGKVELTVRNMGTAEVNLAHYKFVVKAHVHGSMAIEDAPTINQKLRPGNQVKVVTRDLALGHCGTLAWYTAEAEGQNLRFTAYMVPDANIRVQVGSVKNIRIDPLDRKGEIDEYTAIFFQAEIHNFGDKPVEGYDIEGTVDLKTNKGTHWYPFRLQGGDTLAPGMNVVDLRLRGDGNHATIALPDGPIWWQKPEWMRIELRVISPGGCGLKVPYSGSKSGDWKKD